MSTASGSRNLPVPGALTVRELLAEAAEQLPSREGLPDPAREARWLLAHVLERSEGWLWAHPEAAVNAEAVACFRAWVAKRAAGQPAHYVIGACPFWGRGFEVSPAVLIPRPETELLVARALQLQLPEKPQILDVGTGSGCLAVTLALELPEARVVATDVSLAALVVARKNAMRLGGRVHYLLADLASPLRGGFHLVVANLPYVPEGELPALAPELAWEPRVALAGGVSGTELLQRLVDELPRLLEPRGYALLEHGEGQAEFISAHLAARGLKELARERDVSGRERLLVLQKTESG